MTLVELTATLLRVFEGYREEAYQDSGGVWTIGFGHTGPAVVKGVKCTQAEAEAWLASDLGDVLILVADRPLLEAVALASFGYNCGRGALRRVLAEKAKLEQFVHVRGRIEPGLVARRALEAALIQVARGL
jgi:lysozyme